VIQQRIGCDVTVAQWIVKAYALMLRALVLAGGAADRYGRSVRIPATVLEPALPNSYLSGRGRAEPCAKTRPIEPVDDDEAQCRARSLACLNGDRNRPH